jgi:hypothetical protein
MSEDRVREVAGALLARELSVGYPSRAQLLELVADALDDDELEATHATVEALVDGALIERRREEETWREPTDHDRLVAALDELDRRGIVSRECYGATIRDAEREVRLEAERLAATAQVRGTCTFNIQDAEGAASGGLLYLSVASFGGGDDAAIGAEVAAALRGHGLEVEWSGQMRDRLGVRVPDWRVRRSTGDPQRRTMCGYSDVW